MENADIAAKFAGTGLKNANSTMGICTLEKLMAAMGAIPAMVASIIGGELRFFT